MTDPISPDSTVKPAGPAKRRRKWLLRASLLLLLFAVLTPLAVVYYYTRPAQLIPVVEEALFESTGLEATIKHAEVNTKGEITIEGVTLRVPGAADPFATFMTIERIEMAGSFRELLDGSYRPSNIDLFKAYLHLVEDVDSGQFNYELISPPEGGDADRPIPRVTIRQGKILFNQLLPDRIESLGEMGVEGELSPDPDVPKGYRFSIAETDAPEGVKNIMFTGKFDLKAPSLDMKAEHFRFSDEQRYFVPSEFRTRWTRAAPTGEMPELSLSLRPNEFNLLDLHEVRLKLVDVGLNLDLLDFEDPGQRDIAILLRSIRSGLKKHNGEIVVDPDGFTLTGTGQIEQRGLGISPIVYSVNAKGGINEGEPFKVEFKTEPFVLSERYQFGLAFSPLTSEGYRRFRPSGTFTLSAVLDAPGGDSEVDWHVDISVVKGKMAHAMFPVPLENVQGSVRITPDRATIGPLTAKTINGAGIKLKGFAEPLTDVAEVNIDLHITDAPIDQVLRDAMQKDARENLERFFNRAVYRQLVERGKITPLDKPLGDLPQFTIGGTCDVYVPILRPPGPDQDYSVEPELTAKGLSLVMEDFPYPVTAQRGTVILGADFVEIEDLHLTGPTGGQMTLNGDARKGTDGEYRPNVKVTDAAFPIDHVLLAALGEEAEELLTELKVTGGLELSGKVFQPADSDEPDVAFDIKIKDGTTTPYNGRVTIDGVQGSFKLNASGLTDLNLNGIRGESKVGISGSVDWSQEDRTTAALTFTPTNMRWTPELVDVLPPTNELRAELTDLYDEYDPAGRFDAKVQWVSKGGDEEDDFMAELKPKTLAFNLLGGRLDFTDMSGRVLVYEDVMQLDKLRGSFADPRQPDGKGVLEATGDIGFEEEPRIGLVFKGQAHTGSATAKLLLPDGANDVIDSIKFKGVMDVHNAELVMTKTGGELQTTGFEGMFKLDGSEMNIAGLQITGYKGSLDVDVKDEPGKQLPAMAYTLSADEMLVSGRKVEKFRISADNTKDRSVLRTGRGTGSLYHGTVLLEASLDLNADGGVRVRASIHDTELKPLLKPKEPWNPKGDRKVVERDKEIGVVSASLMLDSSYEPDGPRYGRGAMRFRNAELLSDTQVGLLLLQTIALKVPDLRGFDRGAAEFDVQGSTMTFRTLWMENRGKQLTIWKTPIYKQGMRIDGTGTITFPDTTLDLKLNTTSTGTASRIPLRGLLDELLNEIASYRVTGTLDDPKVRYQVLRGTREALGGDGKAP